MSLDELESKTILMVNTTKQNYSNVAKEIVPYLAEKFSKIGYITINRPYATIVKEIQEQGLQTDKFYFVDAITATVQSPPVVDNCIFINAPSDLTDLGLAFSSLLSDHGCDVIFVDTISTLIVYKDIGAVTKFVHNLVTKSRVNNKKAVLLAVRQDSEKLLQDLNMFVDAVIER